MERIITAEGVKMLRRVRKHILEEPKRLNMSTWKELKISEYKSRTKDDWAAKCPAYKYAKCGTAACIAGWISILGSNNLGYSVSFFADRILTNNEYSLTDLYYVTSWDQPYQDEYREAKNPTAKAKIAARYINHYIRTRAQNK